MLRLRKRLEAARWLWSEFAREGGIRDLEAIGYPLLLLAGIVALCVAMVNWGAR